MMTLLSALISFSFATTLGTTSLEMTGVYMDIPSHTIVEIQPILTKTVLRTADMKVTSSSDTNPADMIELSEITINDDFAYQFNIEGRQIILEIESLRFDECNTKLINAIDLNQNVKLELVDNTNRLCKDMVDDTWIANVKSDGQTYELSGSPR